MGYSVVKDSLTPPHPVRVVKQVSCPVGSNLGGVPFWIRPSDRLCPCGLCGVCAVLSSDVFPYSPVGWVHYHGEWGYCSSSGLNGTCDIASFSELWEVRYIFLHTSTMWVSCHSDDLQRVHPCWTDCAMKPGRESLEASPSSLSFILPQASSGTGVQPLRGKSGSLTSPSLLLENLPCEPLAQWL